MVSASYAIHSGTESSSCNESHAPSWELKRLELRSAELHFHVKFLQVEALCNERESPLTQRVEFQLDTFNSGGYPLLLNIKARTMSPSFS
jgi:hypothetical protein